ncbi:MAG: transposase domain-containing protein [Alphaproteobacteria bacterium]|nr:transposase domain-containing protein [Alphaproteobacteria bacterium]
MNCSPPAYNSGWPSVGWPATSSSQAEGIRRKNWLFAGSAGGANAAADLYSLIGSCFLQGIDPHAYLVDVFKRLPTYPIRRIAELPRA